MKMKISIYNEYCVQAGRSVSESQIEEHGEDCGDWTTHEGTAEELLAKANSIEKNGRRGSLFDLRVADTIRQSVFLERPDLEPKPRYIIDFSAYGMRQEFDSTEEAHAAILACGPEWSHVELTDDGDEIFNENDEVVGFVEKP
jgi:hypothetical protein